LVGRETAVGEANSLGEIRRNDGPAGVWVKAFIGKEQRGQ
jgi:hypothetical protein